MKTDELISDENPTLWRRYIHLAAREIIGEHIRSSSPFALATIRAAGEAAELAIIGPRYDVPDPLTDPIGMELVVAVDDAAAVSTAEAQEARGLAERLVKVWEPTIIDMAERRLRDRLDETPLPPRGGGGAQRKRKLKGTKLYYLPEFHLPGVGT